MKARSGSGRRYVFRGMKNVDNDHIIRALFVGVYMPVKILIMRRPAGPRRCATLRDFDKLQHHKYRPFYKIGTTFRVDFPSFSEAASLAQAQSKHPRCVSPITSLLNSSPVESLYCIL